ncbi:MAG: DUF981 family protein [Armatimonadota bacterium]
MMIDYLTLMLLNMAAGFFLLAWYVFSGLDHPNQKKWAPGLAVTGVIALMFGAAMALTWPLPAPYSLIFGEMAVLFGAIFLGTAITLAVGGDLITIAVYATFAGLVAIELGTGIILHQYTRAPLFSGAGFILSGLAGLFAVPTLTILRNNKVYRLFAALVLAGTSLFWAFNAFSAYWAHIAPGG